MQRMRAEAQKAMLQQPGMPGQMNQFGMRGGVPNGMMPNELQKRAVQNARNLYVRFHHRVLSSTRINVSYQIARTNLVVQ